MKNNFLKKTFLLAFLTIWLLGGLLFSQSQERFFDTAELVSKESRVTILYPSLGAIRSLIELRKQGVFPSENLIVIGVYHEKERTDYQRSMKFVKDNKLEWFKFHKLSGKLGKDVLFQKNSCTADFKEILKKSDGIIFFGGADIPPSIYKNKTSLLTQISTPYRHYLELSLIFHLLGGSQDEDHKPLLESRPEFPVMGICLGAQSLNVGTGGTLTQDIWSEKYGKKFFEDVINLGKQNWHNNPFARLFPEKRFPRFTVHQIILMKDGKFISELGFKKEDRPYIISSHHQMVGKKGKGIRIAATSLDGKVVEAFEHEKFPNVLGIQFHPDFPVLWDNTTKFRFTPEDKKEITLRAFFENNPPSFTFQKKIWTWFSQKIMEYHKNRK